MMLIWHFLNIFSTDENDGDSDDSDDDENNTDEDSDGDEAAETSSDEEEDQMDQTGTPVLNAGDNSQDMEETEINQDLDSPMSPSRSTRARGNVRINLWNLDGKKDAIMIAWNVIFGYPNIRILGYPEHFAIQVSKY